MPQGTSRLSATVRRKVGLGAPAVLGLGEVDVRGEEGDVEGIEGVGVEAVGDRVGSVGVGDAGDVASVAAEEDVAPVVSGVGCGPGSDEPQPDTAPMAIPAELASNVRRVSIIRLSPNSGIPSSGRASSAFQLRRPGGSACAGGLQTVSHDDDPSASPVCAATPNARVHPAYARGLRDFEGWLPRGGGR